MKKIFKSIMFAAIAAFIFTACEDVPAPYIIPGTEEEEPTPEGVVEGDGSIENPFNTLAAIKYINSLESGAESPSNIYIKGKIVSVKEEFTTQYGNGTFYISDDGTTTNQLYIYRALYLGNQKFKSGDTQIAVGDEVIICGLVTLYSGNTPETVQNKAYIYSLNGNVIDGGDDTPGEAKGSGTLADPYNAVAANNAANALADNATSGSNVYIKGKVASIKEQYGTQYGNATFYISDDGTSSNQFYIYRALYLGNQKYTSGDLLSEGDEVIVCGKITKYVNAYGTTLETVQGEAYLYSLNGKAQEPSSGSDTPGEPKGSGTQADPFNVAAAIAKCKEAGETATNDIFFVKGIVKADYTVDSYKNATFDLVDTEGSSEKFTAYRVKGADGQDLKVGYKIPKGATVIVSGKLVNYKSDTPETAQNTGTLISVNGQAPELDSGTSGGGTEPSGGDAASALTNGNFETWADGLPTGWKSASTASSATLQQSSDAHGGSYAVIVKGDAGSNKRLASQEIKLAAGTYTFSFWVKPTTANAAQVRPGYVPVADGKVGTYAYGDYATLTSGWQQVNHEFTLTAETTICLVVMNPKASTYSSGEDVIIDDATLTKK